MTTILIFFCGYVYVLVFPDIAQVPFIKLLSDMQHKRHMYHISSPISLVIFSVSDTEISEIFHEKHGLSYSQGFGIQKQFLNLVFILFFADNTSSVGRSLTFRVLAYR